MPTHIPTSFCGAFLLGDNVNENVETLTIIYNHQLTLDVAGQRAMRKPIILLCASITEAFMYDLVYRIRYFTREGVAGIPDAIATYLRGVPNDDFSFVIDQCKKHEIIGKKNDPIYNDLRLMRDLRNRIHIQNVKNILEQREHNVFTRDRQLLSEKTTEYVLKYLEKNYSRTFDAVGGVTLPWEPHVAHIP